MEELLWLRGAPGRPEDPPSSGGGGRGRSAWSLPLPSLGPGEGGAAPAAAATAPPPLLRTCPEPAAMADLCTAAPTALSPGQDQVLAPALGSSVTLNCTFSVAFEARCPPTVQWLKDGHLLGNHSLYDIREVFWGGANASQGFVSSVLEANLTSAQDYGALSCSLRNLSATFTLQKTDPAGHILAVLASLLVLLVLLLAALLYVRCRLRVLLWYRDKYGDVEMNDGKLYDAYISYTCSPEDRKFVNFILKPQLENRHGYKLLLDDRDVLPNSEPSADLIMNLSRCRRLIVVLSDTFLAQAWCRHTFREGLWRLLELSRKPIFIAFEGQSRSPSHPALRLLRQHRHLVTLLLWRPGSVELRLALPRKVHYRALRGDPQTQLQEDKDPMLTLHGGFLEGRPGPDPDPDPEGDLGVRGPIFKDVPPPRLNPGPQLPGLPAPRGESQRNELDVSDLGSRNYGARTDFYCLVTEDDV
ncbi:single Ig IL-1-related receptor isoform X3 [Monodelphis domestica]|uniref:single Ig IL-1-related receptor isoform X3 n=1 Tax=Monodelphis domestica TaxID=13616 RepID=UPI0024E23980|nr:single Ig IL-1-related receptor isoform X3 [Monodelphis domestica]